MKRNHYVYLITNLINGKMYIGKRSTNKQIDEDNYMGSGLLLGRAKSKYGEENFIKTIIEVCKSEEEALTKEKCWIEKYQATKNDRYYNIASGGSGGNTISGYTDEKRKEFGKKIGLFHIGKKRSKESRIKMSVSSTGIYHSEETKRKISEAGKKRKHTKETKQKLREINLGKYNPNSQKCIIVFNNTNIVKDTKAEAIAFMVNKYNIGGVKHWFGGNIPQKYKDCVSYCGSYEDYIKEYKQKAS